MIERIIEFSVRNRFLVILGTLALIAAGIYAIYHTPIDAIPDLSENQVIVFADWMGHTPREIEDQVTFPLSVNLQGLAGVKAVRSTSEFNFSMVNIIFEDKVDFYFARQRVLERPRAEQLDRAAGGADVLLAQAGLVLVVQEIERDVLRPRRRVELDRHGDQAEADRARSNRVCRHTRVPFSA